MPNRPSFPRPGSLVQTNANAPESGVIGYIRKTKPKNGDPLLVYILEANIPSLIGCSLSYNESTVTPYTPPGE